MLERLAGSQPVLAQIYYDPLLGLGTLLILAALYALAYTLVALVVIFFVPLNNLETRFKLHGGPGGSGNWEH